MLCACSPNTGEAETGVSLELTCYLMQPNSCAPGSMGSLPQKHVVGRDETRHLTPVSGLSTHKHTHIQHTQFSAHTSTHTHIQPYTLLVAMVSVVPPFLLASPLAAPPALLCPPLSCLLPPLHSSLWLSPPASQDLPSWHDLCLRTHSLSGLDLFQYKRETRKP